MLARKFKILRVRALRSQKARQVSHRQTQQALSLRPTQILTNFHVDSLPFKTLRSRSDKTSRLLEEKKKERFAFAKNANARTLAAVLVGKNVQVTQNVKAKNSKTQLQNLAQYYGRLTKFSSFKRNYRRQLGKQRQSTSKTKARHLIAKIKNKFSKKLRKQATQIKKRVNRGLKTKASYNKKIRALFKKMTNFAKFQRKLLRSTRRKFIACLTTTKFRKSLLKYGNAKTQTRKLVRGKRRKSNRKKNFKKTLARTLKLATEKLSLRGKKGRK